MHLIFKFYSILFSGAVEMPQISSFRRKKTTANILRTHGS